MSYKTYENYKYSGLKWIAEIPQHWETHKIKDFLNFKIGGTPSTSIESYFEGDNIWVSIADLNNNCDDYIFDSTVKISDEAIKASNVKLISKDSLLYSFKLSVGLTAFAGCELYTNEAIASFEPNDFVDLNFLKYFFQVGFENNAVENIYGAKLFNTDLIKFARFSMPKDKTEQIQIANYLDKKTSEIDENIAKNKELISLLEEKKMGLINQVVTKGLDSDTSMKDSGIDWIGEIPENWKICSLNKFFDIKNGSTPKNNSEFWDGDICWITPADYKTEDIYINESSRHITKEGYFSCGTNLVPKGSLIVSNRAPIGLVAIANRDLCTNQGCKSLKVKTEINTKYVYYVLSITQKELENLGRGTTFMELSSYDLGSFKIPIPPINDQMKIAKYLDSETDKLHSLLLKIHENNELLEEYKTSLIHHVVTGKIDVRNEI